MPHVTLNVLKCRKCDNEQPVEEFYMNNTYAGGYDTCCKNCYRARVRGWCNEQARVNFAHNCIEGGCHQKMKVCGSCKSTYSLALFPIKRMTKQAHASSCKICLYKRNALRRNIPWMLDEAEATKIMARLCVYCLSLPVSSNGLDRIDNNIGYVSSNVAPCCAECNSYKSSRSVDEFLAWLRRFDINTQAIRNRLNREENKR